MKASGMKKKIGILITAIIIITGGYTGLVTKNWEKKVSIPYSMLKTGEQLNNAANLIKWFRPFAGNEILKETVQDGQKTPFESEGFALQVLQASTVGSILRLSHGGNSHELTFSAASEPTAMDECTVTLRYKASLLAHWLDRGKLEEKALESLENLKTYMEDTRQFYGYEIEQTTVTDTAYIFKSSIVPATDRRAETKKLYDELIAYANANNGGYNGVRIFYATPYGTDKIMLFASIGVSNEVKTVPGGAIQYKRMPLGKNLLMATYQGPLNQVTRVFQAMESFKADHKLSSMAIPYMKFMSDGYDFADDQVVQLKVYYPIF
jgi:hypothetical protein